MNGIPPSKKEQVGAGLVVGVPPALTLGYAVAYGGPDMMSIVLLIGMYLLTGFGVTIGFHRYFAHESFQVPFVWFRYALGILGAMALVGLIADWKTMHDPQHHRYADKIGDPHSPHRYGDGFFPKLKGACYSHIGWFFFEPKEEPSESVRTDPLVRWIDRMLPLIVTLGLLAPGCLGMLFRISVDSFFDDVIWGGLARLFLVHHSTWSVNSVSHLWGSRPFVTNDRSVDNRIVAMLALGEGNQNTHHAFPRSASHALLPGQCDPSFWVIRLLEKIGLITEVIVPSSESIEALRA